MFFAISVNLSVFIFKKIVNDTEGSISFFYLFIMEIFLKFPFLNIFFICFVFLLGLKKKIIYFINMALKLKKVREKFKEIQDIVFKNIFEIDYLFELQKDEMDKQTILKKNDSVVENSVDGKWIIKTSNSLFLEKKKREPNMFLKALLNEKKKRYKSDIEILVDKTKIKQGALARYMSNKVHAYRIAVEEGHPPLYKQYLSVISKTDRRVLKIYDSFTAFMNKHKELLHINDDSYIKKKKKKKKKEEPVFKTVAFRNNHLENLIYIAGSFDISGWFMSSVEKDEKAPYGFKVYLGMSFSTIEDRFEVLKSLKDFLRCGSLKLDTKNKYADFYITDLKSMIKVLDMLIPFLKVMRGKALFVLRVLKDREQYIGVLAFLKLCMLVEDLELSSPFGIKSNVTFMHILDDLKARKFIDKKIYSHFYKRAINQFSARWTRLGRKF